jgi:surfactin synthase thioesterase subunit
VYPDEVRAWDRYTVGGFEQIEVDGDHWFLNRNRERILTTLSAIAAQGASEEVHRVAAPEIASISK